jgi:predicted ATPase
MTASNVAISKIGIQNFKSIKQASLELRPLTVLVGENSAGKSSVLQAVVFLAQMVRSRSDGGIVTLNGPELRLGSFNDVAYLGTGPIEIGLSAISDASLGRRRPLPPQGQGTMVGASRQETTWTLSLADAGELGIARVGSVRLDDPADGQLLVVEPIEDPEERRQTADLVGRSQTLSRLRLLPRSMSRGEDVIQETTLFKGTMYIASQDGMEASTEEFIPAVAIENGLPSEIYVTEDESFLLAQQWLQRSLMRSGIRAPVSLARRIHKRGRMATSETDTADAKELADRLFPEFRSWVDMQDRSTGEPESRRGLMHLDEATATRAQLLGDIVPSELAALLIEVRDDKGAVKRLMSPTLDLAEGFGRLLTSSIHYLGPLREDPSPFYPPAIEGGVATLGRKGESTVAILHARSSERVLCPISGDVREMTLIEAVGHWVKEFAFAKELSTEVLGKTGITLTLTDTQTELENDLTSVGVGASQLLPVIVICLLAKPGDIVLIEQPELHLHPAPQQILGDFLLGIAESGRQLLVETHSEYLINRLRLRVAEDEYQNTEELVRIWYATRNQGQTTFKAMEPDRYGSFDEWPEGFFDQSSRESEQILRAVARKRRAR